MNYFLTLIILLICCAFFYLHKADLDKDATNQETIRDFGVQIKELQGDKEKLEDTVSTLKKGLEDVTAEAADLGKQLQAVKDAAIEKSDLEVKAVTAAAVAATAVAPAPPSNTLGTITTLDGKTYRNCQLLKVGPDRIVISHSSGINDILLVFLPPELQKRFGADIHPAAESSPTPVQVPQGQNQAEDSPFGHP